MTKAKLARGDNWFELIALIALAELLTSKILRLIRPRDHKARWLQLQACGEAACRSFIRGVPLGLFGTSPRSVRISTGPRDSCHGSSHG